MTAEYNDNSRYLELQPAMETLILEIGSRVDELDTGALLAACLLDPGTQELVAIWLVHSIDSEHVCAWVESRDHRTLKEGRIHEWMISRQPVLLTSLASFILRFLPACAFPDSQILRLVSGLLECGSESVKSLLSFLKLDGELLQEALEARGLVMMPVSGIEKRSPHRMECEYRFNRWCAEDDDRLRLFWDGGQGAMPTIILSWLSSECDEIPIPRVWRYGDIALFTWQGLSDVCVFDEGDCWRSLTRRPSGEAIAEKVEPARAFRPRRPQDR